MKASWIETIEKTASLVMIVLAVPFVLLFMHAMSTSSLGVDEIHSVAYFSSQGPLQTLRSYELPNNHILFNFINSITPGAGSYDPLRARFWSFLFVAAALLIGALSLIRQGRFLAGALFFQFIGVNYWLLDQGLQARGYGLLLLFSCLSAALVVQYCQEPRGWKVYFLGILSALGTWTVPVYAMFAAPLFLILFVWWKRREILWGALLFLGGVLGFLAIHGKRTIHFLSHYKRHWSTGYDSLDSVRETLETYLLGEHVMGIESGDWQVLAYVVLVAMVPALLLARANSTGKSTYLLAACSLVFLVACLVLRTPPVRATSFIALPLAYATASLIGDLVRTERLRLARPVLILATALYFCMHTIGEIRDFRYLPVKNYQGVAEQIAAVFPSNMRVFVTRKLGGLVQYYWKEDERILAEFNKDAFALGEELCLETRTRPDQPFNPHEFCDNSLCLSVRERVGHQRVYFTPPQDPGISNVTDRDGKTIAGLLTDRDLSSYWRAGQVHSGVPAQSHLNVELEPGKSYRSLCIVSGDKDRPGGLIIEAKSADSSISWSCDVSRRHDRLFVCDLGDRRIQSISITVLPGSVSDCPTLSEMWVYPEVW